MNRLYSFLLLCCFCLCVAAQKSTEVKVLQWNVWQEGTMVPGGYDAIVNEIVRLKPDFVTFSEVRNYHKTRFCDRIVKSLAEKGETYYSFYSYDTGLLSRHPISDSTTVYPCVDDHGSIYRMVSKIGNQEFAIYTAHLDYLSDAYYNVRGYHGSTWKEIPIPESVAEILEFNDASKRDDGIRAFLQQAKKDIAADRVVMIGGDFNEPSHLDWIRETKDLYDHHGFIIPWTVTLLLDNAGFVDTYRTAHPDVLNYPGFTYPSNNPLKKVGQLSWTPKADERERIDYLFFYPHRNIQMKSAVIFGPDSSIVRHQRVKDTSKDKHLLPLDVWPSDHKGVFVKFRLKNK